MIDMPTPGDLGVRLKALNGWSSSYCVRAVVQTCLPAPQTPACANTCDCIPGTCSDQVLLQHILGGVEQLLLAAQTKLCLHSNEGYLALQSSTS